MSNRESEIDRLKAELREANLRYLQSEGQWCDRLDAEIAKNTRYEKALDSMRFCSNIQQCWEIARKALERELSDEEKGEER